MKVFYNETIINKGCKYCKHYTNGANPIKGIWNLYTHGCMLHYTVKLNAITGDKDKQCGDCEVLNKYLKCQEFEELEGVDCND